MYVLQGLKHTLSNFHTKHWARRYPSSPISLPNFCFLSRLVAATVVSQQSSNNILTVTAWDCRTRRTWALQRDPLQVPWKSCEWFQKCTSLLLGTEGFESRSAQRGKQKWLAGHEDPEGWCFPTNNRDVHDSATILLQHSEDTRNEAPCLLLIWVSCLAKTDRKWQTHNNLWLNYTAQKN